MIVASSYSYIQQAPRIIQSNQVEGQKIEELPSLKPARLRNICCGIEKKGIKIGSSRLPA
jgi:hypothetical protein